MKKLLLLLSIIFLLGFSTNAFAVKALWDDPLGYSVEDYANEFATYVDAYEGYTGSAWTGYYIGTILNTNTSAAVMEALISYYLDVDTDIGTLKVNFPDTTNGALNITYDAGNKSGGWFVTGDSLVNFYAVKGGNDFALYYVDPSLSSGIWSTTHLVNRQGGNPEISHFEASITTGEGTPIPEPATMLLLGLGLVGLAGFGRKKFKK